MAAMQAGRRTTPHMGISSASARMIANAVAPSMNTKHTVELGLRCRRRSTRA
jgi:hypothetical protein